MLVIGAPASFVSDPWTKLIEWMLRIIDDEKVKFLPVFPLLERP